MFYNMRQVKINSLNMGVFGCDYAKGGSQTATNIDHPRKVLKTLVGLNDLINNYRCVVEHCCVENLIESGVLARVLKCMRSMDPVKWYSSFNNRIFQLGPEVNGKLKLSNWKRHSNEQRDLENVHKIIVLLSDHHFTNISSLLILVLQHDPKPTIHT